MLARLIVSGVSLGLDDIDEPLSELGILELKGGEESDQLLIDLLLAQANARMPDLGVVRAAVLAVLAFCPVRRILELFLARDGVTAVAAGDERASKGQLRAVIDLEVRAELVLHLLKGRAVDQRLELFGIPLPLILNVSDVDAIVKDAVQRRLGELRGAVGVDDALAGEQGDQRFERQRLEREEFENAFDLWRVDCSENTPTRPGSRGAV
jgi:hypothetical protein